MMARRLPDFAIIGAMKCGTSSLHEQLAQRPGIFMSDPKEPQFFSDDEVFVRGLDWYASLFASARNDQICGESSTHYSKQPTYPHTVGRIRRYCPDLRLVYVMRDPVQRIVSQYIHEWSQREVRGSLEQAIRSHGRFVAYSSYAMQLDPYLRTLGRDAVLPVFFERLTAEPDAELERICRFLKDPSQTKQRWNTDLGVQNASIERLRRSTVRDGLLALPGVRGLKAKLPKALRERAKSRWQMRERPTLPEALQREIEVAIDADLEQLGTWLGTRLTCRGWKQQVLELRDVVWGKSS